MRLLSAPKAFVSRYVSDLRESEEKFRQLGEHCLDAIIMADANGNVSYWSAAVRRMFGYAPSKIIGRSVHGVLVAERHRAGVIDGYRRFVATGPGEVAGKIVELSALRKDGTEFPIELSPVSAVRSGGTWPPLASRATLLSGRRGSGAHAAPLPRDQFFKDLRGGRLQIRG